MSNGSECMMEVDDLIELYRSPYSIEPMPALKGLDEVNWTAVQDAYGPAHERSRFCLRSCPLIHTTASSPNNCCFKRSGTKGMFTQQRRPLFHSFTTC